MLSWAASGGYRGRGPARLALQVQRGGRFDGRPVDWVSDQPGPATALQVRLWPDLRYAVGTEYGAFDYSLAARTSITLPLWTGAQLVANAMARLAVSDQATASGAFSSLRQPEGLRALALHQTLWPGPVPYTQLTLPTKRTVEYTGGSRAARKKQQNDDR